MSHPEDVAPETEQVSGIPQRKQAGAFETAPKFAPLPEEAEVVSEGDVEVPEDEA